MRSRPIRTALALVGGAALLLACTAPATTTPAEIDGAVPSGTAVRTQPGEQQLSPDVLMYPRVIELQHGSDAGTILASATTFTDRGGEAAIFASADGGASFEQRALIPAAEVNGDPGLCCGSVFELPEPVGSLPAGTVLWSATVGQEADPRRTSVDVWSSADAGRTWEPLGTIARSEHDGGIWEPEFSVDADGTLAVYVAQEGTESDDVSQRLVRMTSEDGVSWGDRQVVVDAEPGANRPGMPNVRRLGDGSYLMVYEICAAPGQYDCAVYTRTSADGIDWGDPLGEHRLLVSTEDRYLVAAPTVTRIEDGSGKDRIVVVGQMLRDADGAPAVGNGATVMVSDDGVSGPWREVAAPIAVPDAVTHPCPNYSSTLLPVEPTGSVLQIATRLVDDVCLASFSTGPTD